MSLKDVASNMNSYLKIAPRGFFNWGGTHLRSDLNVESVYMAVEILSHQFPQTTRNPPFELEMKNLVGQEIVWLLISMNRRLK